MVMGLFLLQAFNSLEWRIEHDTSLLHYAGFLMDKYGSIPYKDIFETSMPATFAFHYFVGSTFGYGDLSFRIVDLVLLGGLSIATYISINRFGRVSALWAVVLFGIHYLYRGQAMSLQRDYIGIIPVAFAVLVIPNKADKCVHLSRFALVGILFGLSALIKPHLTIALPVIFGTLLAFRWISKDKSVFDFFVCSAVCFVFFLTPLLFAVILLIRSSAFTSFLDIIMNYLPLHNSMTGLHQNLPTVLHARYLIEQTLSLGGLGALFLCSLFAYYRVSTFAHLDKALRLKLICLFLCTCAYAIYPTLAGKFWGYHYMPFAYFCSISAALCLYSWPDNQFSGSFPRLRALLPLLILLIALAIQVNLVKYVSRSYQELRSGVELHAPKKGRVDEIADWLKNRLRHGDTVQPLDWSGGTIHAMLIAEAELATRFMYDYHFYHHISSPYIQSLRGIFIEQLNKAYPRFIIEIQTGKPWVSGIDTTREFPELRKFLEDNYEVVHSGDDYLIYETKSDINAETIK